MQYAQDYDEIYPAYKLAYGSQSISWPSLTFPYTKSAQIYLCPSTSPQSFPSPFAPALLYYGQVQSDGSDTALQRVGALSYSMNVIRSERISSSNRSGWYRSNWGSAANPKTGFIASDGTDGPVALAAVPQPSTTIYVVEGNSSNASSSQNSRGQTLRQIPWESGTDYGSFNYASHAGSSHNKVLDRHLEGFNILWADGHVKWRKTGGTTAQEWSIQED